MKNKSVLHSDVIIFVIKIRVPPKSWPPQLNPVTASDSVRIQTKTRENFVLHEKMGNFPFKNPMRTKKNPEQLNAHFALSLAHDGFQID